MRPPPFQQPCGPFLQAAMEAEVRSTMAEKGRSAGSYAYQRLTGGFCSPQHLGRP